MVTTAYDELIQELVAKQFPQLQEYLGEPAWLWIKAQVWQESNFNPNAVSPAGAVGLMQLMPGTDKWIDGDLDATDPRGNLDNGIWYMAYLFGCFREIPTFLERLRFAQAAYNGGRGYVNYALALARQSEGLPFGYKAWSKKGRLPGLWQTWQHASPFLMDPLCRCRGKRPDYQQIMVYVARIGEKFNRLVKQASR